MKSSREMRNVIRGRLERLLAGVERWGRAVEAARSAGEGAGAEEARAELAAAEEQLLAAYHELPR